MSTSRVSVIASLLCLMASGCAMPSLPSMNLSGQNTVPDEQAVANAHNAQCETQAKSRLALFDRPDTYPVSDEEKRNAYQALFSQCMKSFEKTIASPKPDFDMAAANAPADLANLSPAAGGSSPRAADKPGAVTYSNGLMIIDTTQLGKAGTQGKAGTAITGGAAGSTVVVVQAPPSTSISYPPAPAAPAAIPVAGAAPSMAEGIPASAASPEARSAKPRSLIGGETGKPAEEPKKTTKSPSRKEATTSKKTEERTIIFAPTRFQQHAEPVSVDINRKTGDLNGLSPAAGGLLDKAVTTNRPAAKD